MNTEADSLLSHKPIRQFRDSVLQANMGYLDSINTLLTDTNGVTAADLNNAANFIAAIKQPNKLEKDLKDVYTIILNMDVNGNNLPDNTQANKLRAIANKCPYNYGPAVWIARALLSEVDTNVIYSNNCEDIRIDNNSHRAIRNEQNDTLPAVKVYPNPANSVLNVEVNMEKGQTNTICLYNALGEEVKCEELKNNLTTLSISNLSSGIYYYRITNMDGILVKADKVILVH